jgi:glutathione S-transferase
MSPSQDIVLYHYPFSPYAKRVTAYLALRGIPYKQCVSATYDP